MWIQILFSLNIASAQELPPNNSFVTFKDTSLKTISQVSTQKCPHYLNADECSVFLETNRVRVQKKLPIFKVYKNCFQLAKQQAQLMAQRSDERFPLFHSDDNKSALNHLNFKQRLTEFHVQGNLKAENVAGGKYKRPEDVVSSWMTSESHKKNILNAKFNSIGIGSYKSKKGLQFWAQCFSQLGR